MFAVSGQLLCVFKDLAQTGCHLSVAGHGKRKKEVTKSEESKSRRVRRAKRKKDGKENRYHENGKGRKHEKERA